LRLFQLFSGINCVPVDFNELAMTEPSTPVAQYTKEGSSNDFPLSPTPMTAPPVQKGDYSQVDIMTADTYTLRSVINHLACEEAWPGTFSHYLIDRCDSDSIEYTRYILNARLFSKDQFLELMSSDASIRAYHTPGETNTTKIEVANMLRADYVGRYPPLFVGRCPPIHVGQFLPRCHFHVNRRVFMLHVSAVGSVSVGDRIQTAMPICASILAFYGTLASVGNPFRGGNNRTSDKTLSTPRLVGRCSTGRFY